MSSTSTQPTHSPGDRKSNRLGRESSPYLLQHQFNPVDWFAWGPEAFAEARRRDVPIFLSVGYSTCYWCHVMERECFENEPIAAQMNASFVCVKVDREERPDVDDVYMAAVQAFTQRGGWPMSVFLEPKSLKPFWAGTYFPAEPKIAGMPSFPQVLGGLSQAWREQRAEIEGQAEQLADAVRERVAEREAPARVGEEQVTLATSQLLRLHDPILGGFGGAPKFPQPAFLDLLLTVRQAAGDEDTRRAIDGALRTTLSRMALGGMFDQVGGGFHRYSVDEKWLVPHFEKMLYDNALLPPAYTEAFLITGDPFFKRIACETLDFIRREMTHPDGGFYSTLDADSEGEEGKFYVWSEEEIEAVLGPELGHLARSVFGTKPAGNFEGHNIL